MERNRKRKILIIKTGYTETLCAEPFKEGKVSLGDVLRTTALLHLYKDDEVTWFTDEKALPLLERNPYIHRTIEFSITGALQLMSETYDVLINLEKNPGLCALADGVHAWQKFGFRFDRERGEAAAYNHAVNALYMAQDERLKQKNTKHWLEHLYAIVGQVWRSQGYEYVPPALGIGPHKLVGLNTRVGEKFSGKEWKYELGQSGWMDLEHALAGEGISWSRQPEVTSLDAYAKWINQHSLIVSCDSLGLHLAMAMGKRVVGLFGPTPAKEVQPQANTILIQKEKMSGVQAEEVLEAIKELLNWGCA